MARASGDASMACATTHATRTKRLRYTMVMAWELHGNGQGGLGTGVVMARCGVVYCIQYVIYDILYTHTNAHAWEKYTSLKKIRPGWILID